VNGLALRKHIAHHRVAVALWLALLLPLGLTAAAAHALSHGAAGAQLAAANGGSTLDDGPCGLCLAASAVGSLALPSSALAFAALVLATAKPIPVACACIDAAPRLAYRSRAPPLSPR
jgi:hypothetical protein